MNLFLTEVKNNKRPVSSSHHNRHTTNLQNHLKFKKQPLGRQDMPNKHKSLHHNSRHTRTNIELEKSIEAMKGRVTAEERWEKIVQGFHLFKEVIHSQHNDNKNTNGASGTTTPITNEFCPYDTGSSFFRSEKKSKSHQRVPSNKFSKTNDGAADILNRMESQRKSFLYRQQEERIQKMQEQQMKIEKINLFGYLLKADLHNNRYRFNIPETIVTDEDRSYQLLQTNNGIITKTSIKKSSIFNIFQKGHEISINKLKATKNAKVYDEMYGQLIDPKINQMSPFVAMCTQKKGNLSIQVQNARNFGENRWDPYRSCYVQRYVYSRNLKAMVMRMEYDRTERGQQKKEYCLHRYQNYSTIFKVNSNGFNDSNQLRAKVSPTYTRPYTLEYSKLTGPGILNRFIEPTSEIRKLIESICKKRVLKLWVDFIQDLTNTIWVIGVKGVELQQTEPILRKQQWLVASQVGYCRLCSGIFKKSNLQNNVSVRMLLEFLHHLRRRTRIQSLDNVEFVNALSLNRKENAMSAVCECCYALIIHQLQLKKYERQLGRLCHIRIQDEGQPPKVQGKELYQWRLMVYLEEIYEQGKQFRHIKAENIVIRYALAKGVEEKWKCKVEHKIIQVKRVKIHYFFSQTLNIEEFLKNTEILVSILSGDKQEKEEVLAQGSTGILTNFKNKFVAQNGQRQTSTVLLFFQSGKYCALTLKVGLVYDGVYRAPQVPLRTIHSVLFPTRDCLNSNPLPKQWMQAFGYDQDIHLKEIKYQDLFAEKKNLLNKKGTHLKKKPIRYF